MRRIFVAGTEPQTETISIKLVQDGDDVDVRVNGYLAGYFSLNEDDKVEFSALEVDPGEEEVLAVNPDNGYFATT